MLRKFKLVQHCHGIVFEGDPAFSLGVRQQLILADAISSGSLSWRQQCCWIEERPIQLLLALQSSRLHRRLAQAPGTDMGPQTIVGLHGTDRPQLALTSSPKRRSV